jgi:enamine deaminase RidA (YjgF/YER057c/UK114 family)
MICRESKPGVGCSIVEVGGARYFFAVAVPRQGGAFCEQAQDVLANLERLLRENDLAGSAVQQSVFLGDFADQKACGRMMRDFYGNQLPATNFVSQPPGEGQRLAVEVWGVGPGRSEVEIERSAGELALVRHDGITWANLAYRHPGSAGESVYQGSLSAFQTVGRRLSAAGFRFDEVVRTWLYLGGITAAEGQTPRYHELNRARTDFYMDKIFSAGLIPPEWNRPVYPASTGVGARGDDLAVSCAALRSGRPDVVLIPLENPRQTSAHEYGRPFGADSPKFCRAMALSLPVGEGNCTITFISGTASIVTAESRHVDQVEQQTHETLDNIQALISAENFRRHGYPGLGAALGDLGLARIYLKRAEDYPQVREICRKRLGEPPAVYTVCDLCRPELLVEIEGIAVKKNE